MSKPHQQDHDKLGVFQTFFELQYKLLLLQPLPPQGKLWNCPGGIETKKIPHKYKWLSHRARDGCHFRKPRLSADSRLHPWLHMKQWQKCLGNFKFWIGKIPTLWEYAAKLSHTHILKMGSHTTVCMFPNFPPSVRLSLSNNNGNVCLFQSRMRLNHFKKKIGRGNHQKNRLD